MISASYLHQRARSRAARWVCAALALALTAGFAPVQGLLTPAACLAQDAWQRQAVREISLEVPAALQPGPDILKNLPANVRDKMKTYEMRIAPVGEEIVVVIARIEYNAGVPVSLQGATNGAMTQAAQALGDKTPKFDVKNTTLSGLNAQRATYSGSDASNLRMEAIMAQRGQVLFQIQVIHKPARSEDADRVMKSIRIDAATK